MSNAQAVSNHEWIPSAPGTLDLARRAARDGAADAREAAERTWAAASLFASRLVYTASYSIAYGVTYPTMLAAQAIPKDNALVRGLVDGAHAALEKVDALHEPAPADSPAAAPAPA
jgi:hypothetical protein